MSTGAVSIPQPTTPTASRVHFPSDQHDGGGGMPSTPPSAITRPPYQPFRRISLPTVPNRLSLVSIASTDSLLEEPPSIPAATPSPSRSPIRRTRSRPNSVDHKKLYKKTGLRPVNEEREDKRRKVIEEFYETERTYVEGLELIYSHFLTPIIASLDRPQPLLERSDLTAVFSNFIDIWNLHRAFFSSLTEHLRPFLNSMSTSRDPPPPMSALLLSHFPYLSLYTPFVTSFHTSVASLTRLLTTNGPFSTFVAQKEADPICGKLKLRDWLLTIVQRCPRYLLLLKDLISCTDGDDSECASLTAVHTLVSKITSSLNASLHTHAQTLALLALQRSTPNLPFQLISPGRTFLKRGALGQSERGSPQRIREFLLFSDCLIWLEGDGDTGEIWDWISPANSGGGNVSKAPKGRPGARPHMLRSRSRSEAELSTIAGMNKSRNDKARQASSGAGEEKWWFRGRTELIDLEVVVPPTVDAEDDTRFEVLSPEDSFAVYADTVAARDEWVAAIRNAKASLFVSLSATHPNTTLTSSASTAHIRRTLQALPHAPGDVQNKRRRGRVEHYVPAVWIPDAKTEACMRCNKTFGWRRRRHHCRLCGRCVCSTCSGSTFFVKDVHGKGEGKPARACDQCYETVFPLVHEPDATQEQLPSLTISSLPRFQDAPQPSSARPASLLMALDSPQRRPSELSSDMSMSTPSLLAEPPASTPTPGGVVRLKSVNRPRSYIQIFENFQTPPPLDSPSGPASGGDATSLLTSESELTHDIEGGPPSPSPAARREDTARRRKRFSLPAVALQTTSVTTHAGGSNAGGKRFSLVLGSRRILAHVDEREDDQRLHEGAAANKLSELLGKKRQSEVII